MRQFEGGHPGWWRRYQAWTLESRWHYVASQLVPYWVFFFVFFLLTIGHLPEGWALMWMAIVVALGIPVHGWFWYPRKKAKAGRLTGSS